MNDDEHKKSLFERHPVKSGLVTLAATSAATVGFASLVANTGRSKAPPKSAEQIIRMVMAAASDAILTPEEMKTGNIPPSYEDELFASAASSMVQNYKAVPQVEKSIQEMQDTLKAGLNDKSRQLLADIYAIEKEGDAAEKAKKDFLEYPPEIMNIVRADVARALDRGKYKINRVRAAAAADNGPIP